MTDASLPIPSSDDPGRPLSISRQPGEVRALFRGHLLAASSAVLAVRERGEPVRYYFPEDSLAMDFLRPNDRESHSALLGDAMWFTLHRDSNVIEEAAWSYRSPAPGAEVLAGMIGLNPEYVDIETDEAEAAAESPVIDDYIRQTDSGAGISQAEHWDPTVSRPGDGA